jgi:hypothetical protein
MPLETAGAVISSLDRLSLEKLSLDRLSLERESLDTGSLAKLGGEIESAVAGLAGPGLLDIWGLTRAGPILDA